MSGRRSVIIVILAGIIALLPLRAPSSLFLIAEEPGTLWYLEEKSLRLGTYEGEGPYLEAMLHSYRSDTERSYFRKDLWHIDWTGMRYKVSLTASYGCDGGELGT